MFESMVPSSRADNDAGQGFPLEGIQQAYWVGQTAALELSTVAKYAVDVDIPGELIDKLTPALNCLVRRHEMLRAVVLPTGEQKVLDQVAPCTIEIQDLRGLPADVCRNRIERLREHMRKQDLSAGTWPQFDIRASHLDTGLRLHLCFALWMMDGWSFHIFLQELLTLAVDPSADLPTLEMSFRDYVSLQAQMRKGPRWQKAWDYWRPRLADFPGPPALPLTRRLAEGQPLQFRHAMRRLSAPEWARIVDFCTRKRITPSLLACAVYAEVLSRYAGSHHFAITILYSGRFQHLPRAAATFGNFGTTILLEVDATRDKSFLNRVETIQRQFWRDSERIEVSGIDVSRAIQQRAGTGPGIGVPVTFTAVAAPVEQQDRRGPPVRIDHAGSHLQVPQVYLDHQMHVCGDGSVAFNWDYVDQIFPAGFIDELCEAHYNLISRLARDERLWDDKEPIDRGRPTPAPCTAPAAEPERLEAAFERQAIAHPDRIAVIAPDATVSYGELRRRAIILAKELRSKGARPGELVAVSMKKGWQQVAAVLGILYSGAAYVPVDPELPEQRKNLLFDASGARVVLIRNAEDDGRSWPKGLEPIIIDTLPDTCVEGWEPANGAATDLAYVIFTSGSTGTPKGVMIDHRGAWNTIADLNDRFALNAGDRVFALSSLSFDLSVYDIFGTLAAGGAIVMPDAERAKEASHWRDLVQRHGVTIWNSVPALMQLAVEGAQDAIMPSLRLVMLSGDWIPLNLPDRIRPAAPHAAIYSLGGATEASIWSILFPIRAIDPEWRSIPYGHAMKHQSVHVLDADLNVCPAWAPGDLYIGGIGVALGYWGDEAKTAASFVTHPVTGERLYRAGDMGRYLGDGEIEFLGRKDFQVKIQGYRVECAEVEAALLAAPGVDAAIVSAAADNAGTRHLIAYVVAESGGQALDAATLRAHLRATLPAYMVPTYFVPLEKMPLSDNGKIVRSALPKPDFSPHQPAERSFAPPVGQIETAIAELWTAVLGTRQIGRHDNFFALGGSSFAGMRLVAKIEERFGRRASFAALVSHPTVADLAEALQRDDERHGDAILTRIRAGDERAPLFCIHPIGGHVMCYAPLAQALPPGRAIYGIRALGLTSVQEVPLISIEAMADRYIAEIRTVQPRGPHNLLGWSLGGLVVQEMARKLEAAGEPPALAAMIDSAVPRCPESTGSDQRGRFARFVADLAAVAGTPLDASKEDLRGLPEMKQFVWLAELMERRGVPADAATMKAVYGVFEASSAALESHAPRRLFSRLLLFLAGQRRDAGHVIEEWRTIAPGLEAVTLDADHYTIMRSPWIGHIAAKIDEVLSRS